MTTPDSPATVYQLCGGYERTPLVMLPRLAERCHVARVFVKDESQRPLGSFKSLGGMYAGLCALSRAKAFPSIAALVQARLSREQLPRLMCASDGNHGLAVAAGAELAGGPARIYLHRQVPQSRAKRIADRGAEIVWIDGTYDDAVDEAARAAERGEGLLIADTAADAHDPVVADVMAGYELMADEIVTQLAESGEQHPTHLFVQAGVGGLAAALARGLNRSHTARCRIVVVEPREVACVGLALQLGHIERMSGELHTAAEMLSCGEASAPALAILQQQLSEAIAVDEPALHAAVHELPHYGGPATTPSGATGLAGFLACAMDETLRTRFALDDTSRVLLIATEGPVPPA
ncbi:MAG: pyridoxal-phosphate dependent enzyme [Planctomycetaceae bacterium]|nr:pyridoxal-phosphate dependent enzyme [Planctomycetaceae bacterium]